MADYVIRQFNKQTGNIVVEYAGLQPVAIDLPIDNGHYPTGADLDQYIMGMIPTWHLERLATIKKGIQNEAEIEAMVQPLPNQQGAISPTSPTTQGMQTL